MTWVTELINNIPAIVEYLSPGFLLYVLFSWTTKQSIGKDKPLIVISAVLSYLTWTLSSTVIGITSNTVNLIICAVSAIIGIAAGVLYKKEWLNNIIGKLGIKRTTNQTIWDDVVGESAWVALLDKEASVYYCGHFRYQQSEDGIVYLVLSTYYEASAKGEVLRDYTLDRDRTIMFQANKYDQIIISKTDPFGHFKVEK